MLSVRADESSRPCSPSRRLGPAACFQRTSAQDAHGRFAESAEETDDAQYRSHGASRLLALREVTALVVPRALHPQRAMWFDSWNSLGRVALFVPLTYAALVMMLRLSGNRTLSKLNSFDLVVTIALGSTLATVILSRDVPFAEGALALALLVGAQYVATWTAEHFPGFNRVLKTEPRLVVLHGRFLDDSMRAARLTRDEIFAVLRQNGVAELTHAQAVVLESDGSLSVLSGETGTGPSILEREGTTLRKVQASV